MWSKSVSNIVWRDFRLPVSSFAMIAMKGFNGKFTTRICDRAFYVTITDADNGRQKSLHTLFDKYLNHMLVTFEQNRMARYRLI